MVMRVVMEMLVVMEMWVVMVMRVEMVMQVVMEMLVVVVSSNNAASRCAGGWRDGNAGCDGTAT